MPASESTLITRRNVLGALAAGALLGATDDPPHYTGFDHVALAVGDAGKSVEFYARIFGNSRQPLFRPTGIDHILLDVSDLDKSVAFYAKVFGPVTQRGNNRTWFQAGKSRLGLLPVAGGKRGGVNHFCVSAAPFEYADATKALVKIGAKLEAPEVAGAPEFRDPDGILVQVMGHA